MKAAANDRGIRILKWPGLVYFDRHRDFLSNLKLKLTGISDDAYLFKAENLLIFI